MVQMCVNEVAFTEPAGKANANDQTVVTDGSQSGLLTDSQYSTAALSAGLGLPDVDLNDTQYAIIRVTREAAQALYNRLEEEPGLLQSLVDWYMIKDNAERITLPEVVTLLDTYIREIDLIDWQRVQDPESFSAAVVGRMFNIIDVYSGRYWSDEEVEQLERYASEGLADEAIADLMGRTVNSIKVARRRKTDIVSRRVLDWSPDQVVSLQEMYSAGMTDKQIAAELGGEFNEWRVHNKRRALGLVQNRAEIDQAKLVPELLRLQAAGSSRKEMAQQLGITVWQVGYLLTSNGLARNLNRSWSEEETASLATLIESRQYTNSQIAEMLGRTESSVYWKARNLAKRTPDTKTPRPWTEADDQELIHLIDAGYRQSDIAKMMSRSPSTIYTNLMRIRNKGEV